jgi:hypothetical protein
MIKTEEERTSTRENKKKGVKNKHWNERHGHTLELNDKIRKT